MLFLYGLGRQEQSCSSFISGTHTRARWLITRHAIIIFSGAATAESNVAGLPAAARAVREAALGGARSCAIAVPGGWVPGHWTQGECHRLAGTVPLAFTALEDSLAAAETDEALLVTGEQLIPAQAIRDALDDAPGTDTPGLAWTSDIEGARRLGRSDDLAALRAAGATIVRNTSKPGDGIVSRYVNRPISQTISRILLNFRSVRPIHATIANGALALAMFLTLVFDGDAGLIMGALLFQAASIIDGVDGEIARATFRSSDTGAMLDSSIDAATNLGFIAGVVINVWQRGDATSAMMGAVGLGCLAFGLTLLGLRSRVAGGPFTFNAVKDSFNTGQSRLRNWLTWLTMRDFYALAGALLILAGFAGPGLVMFASVAAGWLVVVIFTLARQPS